MAVEQVPCSQGGECAVGDVGPGGGIVFYVSEKLQSWGRYIEVAPNGWNRGRPDPNVKPYCDALLDSFNYPVTSPKIGQGQANTDTLVRVCPVGAAATARDYRGGGFNNWSLPSKEEFEEFFYEIPGVVLNEGNPWYWTSTNDQYGRNFAFYEGHEKFSHTHSASNASHVRPVRHFMTNEDQLFLAEEKERLREASERKYKNCAELNKVFSGGIAKSAGTRNKGKATKSVPYVSAKGYNLNKSLDRDKDGLVCER